MTGELVHIEIVPVRCVRDGKHEVEHGAILRLWVTGRIAVLFEDT